MSAIPSTEETLARSVPAILQALAVAALLAVGILALRSARQWRTRRELGERMASRPWAWPHALFLLLLLFLGLLLGQFVLRTGSGRCAETGGASVPVVLASFAVMYAIVLAGVFSMTGLRRGIWGSALGLEDGNLVRDVFRGCLGGLAVLPPLWLAQYADVRLLESLNLPIPEQAASQLLLQAIDSPWYLQSLVVLVAVVLAPTAEEIVFRGVLLPVLIRRMGVGPGILAAAFGFAALHVHLPSFLPLLVLATGLGVAYVAWGSITVPIVMHAVYNLIQIVVLFPLRVEYGPSP